MLFYHFVIFRELPSFSSKSNDFDLNIVDFTKLLSSQELYNSILCRKSAEFFITTTLCAHNTSVDNHVSGAIWAYGVWEGAILKKFMNYLNNHPDWLVFDIGAQVGQYSLFAAKFGRDVIAVEPFYDNVLRIHKAVRIESLENKITLVKNGLSNKREIKKLFPYDKDLGGQTLLNYRNEVYSKKGISDDKYFIETILFDDLISIIPKRNDGSYYKKAIIKIDIEGFEPYAFDQAKNIFDGIEIQVIFMEWVHLPRHPEMANLVEKMIEFFVEKNLNPYDNGYLLDTKKWRNWPQDVMWIKAGL